jgi:hypothetical protein
MSSTARPFNLTVPSVKVAFATALLAAATACSGGTSTGPTVPEGDILLSAGGTAVQSVFTLMEAAPHSVPFRGVREVSIYSGPNPTQFREDVASDGQGNLFYKARDISPIHPNPDMLEILLDLRSRQSLMYRDPAITDVDLFVGNYLVVDLGTDPVVAGVPCVRMHVAALNNTAHDPHFELSVDPVTGMTLAWDEIDAGGVLLTRVEFLSYTPGAPTTNGLLPVAEALTKNPLNHSKLLDPQVDHLVIAPTLPPPGFQLVSASLDHYDDGAEVADYVRQEFSDGFQTVVLMQKAPRITTLEARQHLGKVYVETMTTWAFVTGEIQTCEVILAGRVSEDRLLSMLASAF